MCERCTFALHGTDKAPETPVPLDHMSASVRLWARAPGAPKKFAFTAIVAEGGFIVGRADDVEPGSGPTGYTPLPAFGTYGDKADADFVVHHLNDAMGVSDEEAFAIVGRSMFGAPDQSRRKAQRRWAK